MEEIKTKKKLNKKPLIICLVLALVFGIVGFVDIKSNAAESLYTARIYCKASNTFQGTTTEEIQIDRTVTSNSPIYVYAHIYTEPTTGEYSYRAHVISRSPISGGSSNANRTFTDSDGLTWYYSRGFSAGGSTSATINYSTWYAEGVESFCIINGSILDYEEFASAFKNGTLDYTEDIDYDSFEIDDDMSVIQNLLYNIIRNEKPSENDTTGMGIIKDVEYYEYLTWNNTEDFPIQVEYVPIVQVYSGLFNEKFKKEYYGEWTDFEILSVGTNSYTKRTDSEYLFENDSVGKDFEKDILDKYVEWGDNTYLFYGYRMRYVDENNSKCSPWVYAVPRENGTYFSYIEYSDSSTSNDENITGTDNTYENVEDIEDAKTDIDKENEVIQNMNNTNGNIDTSQATNWLYSVVDFIKTTPSMVGTVLAFLPQPILHGMFVTIFLGCIASAIAIVKALI